MDQRHYLRAELDNANRKLQKYEDIGIRLNLAKVKVSYLKKQKQKAEENLEMLSLILRADYNAVSTLSVSELNSLKLALNKLQETIDKVTAEKQSKI